jgi:hypothetical protein
MKKNILPLSAVILMAGIITLGSCKKNREFVADDDTFADYGSWHMVAEKQGPSPSLASAHGGNDSSAIRRIFQKKNEGRDKKDQFPVGTVFVKETKSGAGNIIELTAMVKRGKSFNTANNDWEWFMLTPLDGKIMDRGANLMNGMCSSCHSASASEDYIFTK